MPPPLSRFPSGPSVLSPYHQQFPGHGQGHGGASHPQQLGANQSYLGGGGGPQISPFTSNGNLLGAGGGANGFGVGADSGLGSHAVRMGFAAAAAAHGGGMPHQQQQQQQQHHGQQQSHGGAMGEHSVRSQSGKGRIRDVWKHNLHEEMAVLCELAEKYRYIAMDTEFPGVVARPMGNFRGKSDYHYQCLRINVDLLKIIQLGITLFNEDGETPPARPSSTDSFELNSSNTGRRHQGHGVVPYAWQFNFQFSLKNDMYNQASIDSLQQAGIDFGLLERDGIDPEVFASLLIPSGLVCYDDVKWISFHGGYDFGYLTKLLTCKELPTDETEFDQTMKKYFPQTYDVKHLMKLAIKMHNSGMMTPTEQVVLEVLQKFEHKSGLETLADTFKIKRVGAAHQAGSDSLTTGRVFFQMRDKVYNGEIPEDNVGKVWGLGVPDYTGGAMISGYGGGGTGSQMDHSPHGVQNGGAAVNGGAPSTPNTGMVGLATTTPGQNNGGASLNGGLAAAMAAAAAGGPMTPGGGGGVFGSFAFPGAGGAQR